MRLLVFPEMILTGNLVKGITKSLETEQIHSGGDANSAYHLPKHTIYEDLVLERGLVGTKTTFTLGAKMIDSGGDFWMNSISKEINVKLRNSSNIPLASWNFKRISYKIEMSEFRVDERGYSMNRNVFAFPNIVHLQD